MFGYLPLGLENTFPFKIFDLIHNPAEEVADESRKEKEY